jgi:hypothetical protein
VHLVHTGGSGKELTVLHGAFGGALPMPPAVYLDGRQPHKVASWPENLLTSPTRYIISIYVVSEVSSASGAQAALQLDASGKGREVGYRPHTDPFYGTVTYELSFYRHICPYLCSTRATAAAGTVDIRQPSSSGRRASLTIPRDEGLQALAITYDRALDRNEREVPRYALNRSGCQVTQLRYKLHSNRITPGKIKAAAHHRQQRATALSSSQNQKNTGRSGCSHAQGQRYKALALRMSQGRPHVHFL